MFKLSAAQRAALRAEAHALHPVVIIGEAGLTSGVLKEIEVNLDAHGLIKVRVFGDERAQRITIYETICNKLGAEPVQHIGKLLVLYRPKKEVEKTSDKTRGKGLRSVTIVQPSPSGIRRPTVKKTLIKGNERVTQGGLIKRAKPRQGSKKKIVSGY